MKPFRLAIVEDSAMEMRAIKAVLSKSEEYYFDFYEYHDPKEYLRTLDNLEVDLALIDIDFGKGFSLTGIDLARIMKEKSIDIPVIHRTSSIAYLKDSLASGAETFILKQDCYEDHKLEKLIVHTLEESNPSKAPITDRSFKRTWAGSSFMKLESEISKIVDSAVRTVHIEGESGTGKEKVCDIFQAIVKPREPFIRVNCSEFSGDLAKSELFGHKKGSFSGATEDHLGAIEASNGSWLFLDELSTLDRSVQSMLLRVIENGEVRKVGDSKAKKVNVRFLTSSNINIPSMIERAEFAADLWHRLNDDVINVQPLRDRKDEIEELAKMFSKIEEGGPFTIDKAAMEILKAYDYRKNNIRQLERTIRFMTKNSVSKTLGISSLPSWILESFSEVDKKVIKDFGSNLSFKKAEAKFFVSFMVESKKNLGAKVSFDEVCQRVKVPKKTVYNKISTWRSRGLLSEDEATGFLNKMKY